MAKDHVDYYYVRWSAYVLIDGRKIDIAGFSLRYWLNQIPELQFYPTIGVDPVNQKEANAVEALLDARPYTRIELYVKGETEADSPVGPGWAGFPYNQFVRIFDGYYQGVGYQSQRSPAGGSVRLTGSAAHWLTALTGTSSKARLTAVKGPGGFAELAGMGPTGLLSDLKALTVDSSSVDIWTELTKPIFYKITEDRAIWGDNKNDSALMALDRMDNESVFTGTADNSLFIPVKLAGGLPDEVLARYYLNTVAMQLYATWHQSNLWEALRAIATEFGFQIVPLVDTATCAPVFGALGGDPYVVIHANEYADCFIDATTPALVTKLVLTGSLIMATSPYAGTPITDAVIGIASVEDAWVGPAAAIRGITVQENAPGWLEGAVSIGPLNRMSVGGAKGILPDAANPDAADIAPPYDYQSEYSNYLTSELGDRVAKTRLLNLLLSARSGWIRGRFRLDICPGSTVAVQVIDDKFSTFNDNPNFIYGLVQGVEITMSSGGAGDTGNADTTLQLTNIRTATEHEGFGGYMTAEVHPVYGTRFLGTRLVTAV